MSGKGDKRRPTSVAAGIAADNWDRIFGKVETCPCGNQEITHLAPDAISYCDQCEDVVEGQTTMEMRKADD